jgi:hypothetical protein
MTDEQSAKAASIENALKKSDADDGKLDKLLSGIDAISKRMDAFEAAGQKKLGGDAEEPLDHGEMKAPTEEIADRIRKDSAGVTAKEHDAERQHEAAMADIQCRADAVSTAWGESAPPPMSGERAMPYRVRLLRRFQRHSKEFSGVDLAKITDPVILDGIERSIYADALAASATPEVAQGYLREMIKTDRSGRQISTFFGEPRTWMQQFAAPARRVTGIRNVSR